MLPSLGGNQNRIQNLKDEEMLNLFSSKKVGSNQKYKKSGSIGNLGEP